MNSITLTVSLQSNITEKEACEKIANALQDGGSYVVVGPERDGAATEQNDIQKRMKGAKRAYGYIKLKKPNYETYISSRKIIYDPMSRI